MVQQFGNCKATYWNGHFLHPGSQIGDSGNFSMTSEKIIFEKKMLFQSVQWKIEIPLKKVLYKNIYN